MFWWLLIFAGDGLRFTMDGFASSVVTSTPTVFPVSPVFPRTRPAADNRSNTHVKTASCVSTSIRRRVRDSVEWSGDDSVMPRSRNDRRPRHDPNGEMVFEHLRHDRFGAGAVHRRTRVLPELTPSRASI